MLGQGIRDGAVGYHIAVTVRVEKAVEASVEVSTFVSVDHVPHFRLAETVVPLSCQFVVRMNLNGKRKFGIDELDEERKDVAISFIVAATNEPFMLLTEKISDGASLFGTFINDRQ